MADRNYALFSKIADVRNSEKEDTYIEPIADPRGLPYDTTTPAKAWFDYASDLPHHETWLNRAELEVLNKWIEGNLWKMLGFDNFSHLFSFEDGWKKAVFTRYSELRVLFSFDN